MVTVSTGNVRGFLASSYRGGVVQVEVSFFEGLAVVSLWVGQAKEPLFEEVTAPKSAIGSMH
jgi:hypothetical protein